MKLRIYVAALVALTPFTSCAFKGIPHRRTPRVSAGCRMSASSSPSPSAETFFKHREKGRVAELSGRLDVAREHFLRALQHQKAVGNIPLASLLFQLANVQAERGEAEEAVRLYRSSFETWPELAEQCDAQNNLGLALEQCKRSNEALEAYSAAISSEPWRPEPRGNLANVLWEYGLLEAAEKELRTALELAEVGPFKVKLLFNLETLLSEEENALRAEEAAAVHDLAVQLSPPGLKTAEAWQERDLPEQCILFSSSSDRCIQEE